MHHCFDTTSSIAECDPAKDWILRRSSFDRRGTPLAGRPPVLFAYEVRTANETRRVPCTSSITAKTGIRALFTLLAVSHWHIFIKRYYQSTSQRCRCLQLPIISMGRGIQRLHGMDGVTMVDHNFGSSYNQSITLTNDDEPAQHGCDTATACTSSSTWERCHSGWREPSSRAVRRARSATRHPLYPWYQGTVGRWRMQKWPQRKHRLTHTHSGSSS